MTHTITYSVSDMYCAHCERAVRSEVSRVEGVEQVEVDLSTRLVTVTGYEAI